MEEIIKDSLGDLYSYVMASSFLVVLLKGNSIKKKQVVILLAMTIISFVMFFVAFIASFPIYREYGQNAHGILNLVLMALAALCLGCGAVIGFWLIGRWLGLIKSEA